MTFLTILGVTEICSFKLVLEGKTGKEIPESSRLEFLEKFWANNFTLSDAEGNTSGSLNTGSAADFTLLRTLLPICQKSRESRFWKVMDSFVLLASLATSRTLSEKLLACLNFTLESKNLSFWYKQKEMISMSYDSNTSSWKPCKWVRLDLIFSIGIYTSIPTRTAHKIH